MYNLPFKEGQKVIEFGGGDNPRFRPNLDVRKGTQVDIVADFNEKLPLVSNEWDGIFCSYCIEHISWRKVKQFLEDSFRVLKPDGTAVFITANTEAQMKWVLERDEWDNDSSCILFGDQNYEENTHRNSLSPDYAIKLLQEVGFTDILVLPWGQLGTDMLIEAKKSNIDRKSLFDKEYFNGGKKVGGYAHEGYRDFFQHWFTFNQVMKEKPKSVLEIGASRGYVLKRIEDTGIPVRGLEISKHCYLTRVADVITEWDICETPWPLKDKSFDLAISIAVFEHIPEDKLPDIFKELERVSVRGLHGIDFGEKDDGFDKTHVTLKPKKWWTERFPASHKIIDKEELEKPELVIHNSIPSGDGKVKVNIGSFTNMFHDGWCNVDILGLHQFADVNYYKFYQCDVKKGLPYEDKTVDLMFSSHFLEHLTYEEAKGFLVECRRVMKKGAVLRLVLPDAEKLIDCYKENKLQIFDEINDGSAASNSQASKLWALLFSGHASAFDWDTIDKLGRETGFDVKKCSFRQGHPQIIKEATENLAELSLFVELT